MKLEGPACDFEMGSLLSHYIGGSSLLVADEVENFYVVFTRLGGSSVRLGGSSVQIFLERALLCLLKIKVKTYQQVRELSRKQLSSLTKNNLGGGPDVSC